MSNTSLWNGHLFSTAPFQFPNDLWCLYEGSTVYFTTTKNGSQIIDGNKTPFLLKFLVLSPHVTGSVDGCWPRSQYSLAWSGQTRSHSCRAPPYSVMKSHYQCLVPHIERNNTLQSIQYNAIQYNVYECTVPNTGRRFADSFD